MFVCLIYTSYSPYNGQNGTRSIKSKGKTTLPKTLLLKTLDFLQQTITMNEKVQWQMIKDSVLFALRSGFSVSLFHFYFKKIEA
jgi:hypothetical protein